MKIKNICCIGAGYVGGPTMAVIAQKNPDITVTVVDVNTQRIQDWNDPDLNKLPIYEPGLDTVVAEARGRNLFFSTDVDTAIDKAEMIFISVNTPTKTYGAGKGMAADLKYVELCARQIARVATTDKIVVEKSTLPVKTAEAIQSILDNTGNGVNFQILSNPEFLAEGTAIHDLFKSDRVLIGGESSNSGKKAVNALVEIYLNWIPLEKILTTNVWSSELAKLSSNAMLAQRISSINSLSALCEETGANINELSKAIGMDHRIGPYFLKASVGFGGSCFQKDILNLVYLCYHYGLDEVAEYWLQVVKINDYQKKRFAQKIINGLGEDIEDKKICFLGWAFKANTNDSRESPAIYIADYLLQIGAQIHVFDPMVKENQIKRDLKSLWINKGVFSKKIQNCLNKVFVYNNHNDAIDSAIGIAILTEWPVFKGYDWNKIRTLSKVFDGRYILLGEDGENVLSRNLPLAFIVEGKFWVNNHAHILQPTETVDIGFLCEYLEHTN